MIDARHWVEDASVGFDLFAQNSEEGELIEAGVWW